MKLHAANILIIFGTTVTALAQNTPEMREVLSRLERLEKENEALTEELRALRKDLAAFHAPGTDTPATDEPSNRTATARERADQPTPDETESINKTRIEELSQTKLESSQKFPIKLTGMALFNAYLNGQNNGGNVNPPAASLSQRR